MFLDRFELTHDEAGGWHPAKVPGGVHESLIAAGLLGHPYYGDNEHAARWVEEETWWYRTAFDGPDDLAPGERLRLIFPGVDTVASFWLNGELIGSHESQFRPAVFDVTSLVRARNELRIRFTPPLAGLTAPPDITDTVARMKAILGAHAPGDVPEGEEPPGVMSANLALTLRRKATFSWGWDFGPRLPSVGLTRPAELRRERGAVVSAHHLRVTSVQDGTARVAVDVEVDAFAHDGPLTPVVTLTAPDGRTFTGTTSVTVADARLWWPHDLGEQPLYEVSIELTTPDGQVLDRVRDRIGLRTVTLDRSPDEEGGRLFRFVVNGVPTFARGANWVPASMLTGSVTPETVRALVETARRGNMTMLRIWGGGTYEQDAFYQACDELGVLVWQDFMFACVDYPSDDPTLRAEVAQEAEYQVKRLRNHPCMALWAGNNEVHAMHGLIHRGFEPGNWGWAFFHDLLPSAVSRLSPEIPYWPGSPYSELKRMNGVMDGDRHAWEVWHGVDVGAGGPAAFASRGEAVHFSRYRHDKGRFISEFGLHAAPALDTLRRWTPPGSLELHSPQFRHRNKDVPRNKGDDLMSVETGLPAGLEQYVDFSMACQAEGLKFGIEHYRRRQPVCSGALIWQFNDPWPGLSWSVVDHDLVPKAGFYFAQRAYRPVLASFVREDDGDLTLWVTNSGRAEAALELRVEVATFAGESVLDERVAVVAPPGSSRPVWSAPAAAYRPGPDRFAWVSGEGVEPNRLFFAPLKDLPLGEGRIEARYGDRAVTLVSRGYTYLARVLSPSPGVTFSAGYLDLRDGQEARIEVGGQAADLRVAWYGGPTP
ncbi:glycoside hydrolase family 2 protein [Nonomuraea monospora]|uniref:Beta-mannosidase B n=1 Tax=Nonomuraea monospora TaxID=568818 RepID=A0ABP5PJN8_9ACTN